MGLLLYKSDEMYSSTELIRKSKMIFDKVLNNKIEKAIILRDGKPCFLLMEFKKYEKIMGEYEELKSYIEKLKNNQSPVQSKTIETKQIEKSQETSSPVIQKITPEDKTKIEKLIQKKPEISGEQKLNDTNKTIESMNFDKKMEKESEEEIRIRILKAREERAKILADEKQHKEDLKEELILQSQLKEKKLQKDRELREFWD
ncbi:MAG: hypothetical protein CSA86_05075 [Arcobacter sp.]|nr:MAG: hypothetical protein CSA86_05075 [Arcobacter sp.]